MSSLSGKVCLVSSAYDYSRIHLNSSREALRNIGVALATWQTPDVLKTSHDGRMGTIALLITSYHSVLHVHSSQLYA